MNLQAPAQNKKGKKRSGGGDYEATAAIVSLGLVVFLRAMRVLSCELEMMCVCV